MLTLSGSGNPESLSAEPKQKTWIMLLFSPPDPSCVYGLGDFWQLGRRGRVSEEEEGSLCFWQAQFQRQIISTKGCSRGLLLMASGHAGCLELPLDSSTSWFKSLSRKVSLQRQQVLNLRMELTHRILCAGELTQKTGSCHVPGNGGMSQVAWGEQSNGGIQAIEEEGREVMRHSEKQLLFC